MLHIEFQIRSYVWTFLESWVSSPSRCSSVHIHRKWPKIHLFLISLVPGEKIGLMRGPGSNTSHPTHRRPWAIGAATNTCLSTDTWKKSPNSISRICTWSTAHPYRCTEFCQPVLKLTHFFPYRVSRALFVFRAVILGQLGIVLMLQVSDSLSKLLALCHTPLHLYT